MNKLRHITATFLIAAAMAAAQAQDAPPPRIDLINVPHYLTPSGAPAPLDREKPAEKYSMLGGGKVRLEFKGEHAKLRLTPDQAAAFFATFSNVDDPENLLLYRLEIKKGKREAEMFRMPLFSLKVERPGVVPHNTIKIGETSFKLVTAAKLPSGEYAFFSDKQRVLMQVNDAFTFGID
jgi:hypothetical protein